MSLPKIDVPVYTTELPSTGEKIKFRPFLVKEQKQLLIAQGGSVEQQTQAVLDIVKACTDGAINVNTAPAYDIEYLFMQIRARSVGEHIELIVTCPHCNNNKDTSLDITTVKVEKPDNHKKEINLGAGLTLMMRDPTITAMDRLKEEGNDNAVVNLIASCITQIWKDDVLYDTADYSPADLIEFVENLSPQNFNTVGEFFDSMPSLRHSLEYKCEKCGEDNKATLEGLHSFFV